MGLTRRALLAAAGLLIGATLVAAGDRAKHAAAVQAAVDHWVAASSKAQQTYAKALAAADRQLVRETDDAQRQAMAAGNLAAANDAANVKKEAETRLKSAATDPFPNGRWAFNMTDTNVVLTIADGKARNNVNEATGVVSMTGSAAVIRWTHGYIDRLTPTVDGRVLIEGWNPDRAKLFPGGLPDHAGPGDRR